MKKFITYRCTICNRNIDKQINNLQPFVNKCDITLNCRGRLKPIRVKNVKNILPTRSGLNDWIPRDRELIDQVLLEQETFSGIEASFENHLVLAVKQNNISEDLQLIFSVQHEKNFDYIEYTYNVDPGTISISGKDNSVNNQILKYTVEDDILIYVNGQQIAESSNSDGFTRTLVNDVGYLINFNSPISKKSLVKVVVYKYQIISISNPISFTRNENLNSNRGNAWDNINEVSINGEKYNIYICSDITNITKNSRLNLYPAENDLDLSEAFFLLSRPNYTCKDRNVWQLVPLNNLVEDVTYIKSYIKNKSYKLDVTNRAIIDLASPISYVQFKNPDVEYIQDKSPILIDVSEEKKPTKFIIGPS